jgi:peptide/nickel transport system substrate-binding protein
MFLSRAAALFALALVVACTAQPSTSPRPSGSSGGAQPERTGAPKRVVAAIMGEPTTLSNAVTRAGSGGIPGVDAVEQLVNAGMAGQDGEGGLRPLLATAVPSIENGQWQVFPDGRMQTTWKIKDKALWHDGTPVTSEDMAFTAKVGSDRDMPAFSSAAYGSIEGVDTPDPSTVVVRWAKPFIHADTMFTYSLAVPLPKHLLERAFNDDKANFTQVPYWTSDFVGSGSFKVRDWVMGSHMTLVANPTYVLGRPKVDEIEVRFIPDSNAIVARILAGEVELTMGRGLSLEQGLQMRDLWSGGKLAVALASWLAVYPQMLSPQPAVVADVRFRRGLLHAIDRQAMVDEIQGGLTSIAHSYVSPNTPEYADIQSNIVRYDYDVRRAAAAIDGLGYTKGADGFYRDPSGERLTVEARTTAGDDLQEKTLLSYVDFWQRAGVAVEPTMIPRQRATDREYRANFPAFESVRQPNDLSTDALTRYYGPEAALPESQYRGSNRMRYQSAELDALIDRFYATVPRPERSQVLGQIMRHMTDNVIPLGLYYQAGPIMIGNRLVNVTAGGAISTPAWNAEQWDIRQ